MFKKSAIIIFLILNLMLLYVLFLGDADIKLLNPQGPIALAQRNLFITAILIMLIVALPIYLIVFFVAFKYRASNTKAKRENKIKHKKIYEFLWWIPPTIIIVILAFITFSKTHALDPYRPLDSSVEPVRIQVVALDWKWLFIYPEENIATINYIQFPEKTPLNFELSADGPMNSFWIPSLGGQIYAMTGMSTRLHLMADSVGEYSGHAAEINGIGYSKMRFRAISSSSSGYEEWLETVRESPKTLTHEEYENLSKPSEDHEVVYYSSVEGDLFEEIMQKFMPEGHTMPEEAVGEDGMIMEEIYE